MPNYLPALIVAILAFIPGIYATIQGRKLRDANAAAKIAEGAAILFDDFKEQIVQLKNRISEQEKQIGVQRETTSKAMIRIESLESENIMLKQANRELRRKLDDLRRELK